MRACNNGSWEAHGSLFERKILVKSPEPAIKRKERLNYEQKLLGKIITENYECKLSAKIIT
jgi:hypothetical protein